MLQRSDVVVQLRVLLLLPMQLVIKLAFARTISVLVVDVSLVVLALSVHHLQLALLDHLFTVHAVKLSDHQVEPPLQLLIVLVELMSVLMICAAHVRGRVQCVGMVRHTVS